MMVQVFKSILFKCFTACPFRRHSVFTVGMVTGTKILLEDTTVIQANHFPIKSVKLFWSGNAEITRTFPLSFLRSQVGRLATCFFLSDAECCRMIHRLLKS